jgi:hypothetical protein
MGQRFDLRNDHYPECLHAAAFTARDVRRGIILLVIFRLAELNGAHLGAKLL